MMDELIDFRVSDSYLDAYHEQGLTSGKSFIWRPPPASELRRALKMGLPLHRFIRNAKPLRPPPIPRDDWTIPPIKPDYPGVPDDNE